MFPSTDPKTWSYDTDLPRLFSTHAGAVMNEVLRVVPPVVMIPKCTLPNTPQPLTVAGKEYIVPENCAIGLSVTGVHRNPKYWPHGKATNKFSRCGTDLDEFKPERWFVTPGEESDSDSEAAASMKKSEFRTDDDGDALSIDATPDTSSSFFKPKRGMYIPFSEGARACLGRRFAQVEILAAIAVIFRMYSVELDVDSENDVESMSEKERKDVWDQAKGEAERKMREEMGTIITIQLRGKPVKVRIVERGQELFDWKA
jgi:cytochrome P450